ncbi:MAG: permease prefix domain 1-containing protein [Candidatus Acidiferrales bacterium]
MPDWGALVEQRLAGLALEPEERAEVIAEVAAHLEDICEAMLRQGKTEDEAVRRALSKAGDWQDLQRKILTAKRREQIMKKRVWQLWIPGFLTLILSMVFLTVVYRLGLRARLVWSGPNEILLYMPWLAGLPFFGALGAYISSRAGGSRTTVLFVSVFPAFALAFAFLMMFPIGLTIERIMGRPVDFSLVAPVLLKDGIGWLLVPGAVLLGGGLLAHLLLSTRSSSRDAAIG